MGHGRRNLVFILAMAAGLLAAGIGYYYFSQQIDAADTRINVPVLKHDMPAYSAVTAEDLTMRPVSPEGVDDYTVVDSGDLVGQFTTVPLYEGKTVDRRVLRKTLDNLRGKRIVGVNIDPARSAGVTEGDTVDVYWLTAGVSAENNQAPAAAGVIVARNATVLAVCDENGNSVKAASIISQGVATVAKTQSAPRIVYLVVGEEEAAQVIGGSALNNTGISLAKKTSGG